MICEADACHRVVTAPGSHALARDLTTATGRPTESARDLRRCRSRLDERRRQ